MVRVSHRGFNGEPFSNSNYQVKDRLLVLFFFCERHTESRPQNSSKLSHNASHTAQCRRIPTRFTIACACPHNPNAGGELASRGFPAKFDREPEFTAQFQRTPCFLFSLVRARFVEEQTSTANQCSRHKALRQADPRGGLT